MAEENDRFAAMRATVAGSVGISEATIVEFLRRQPEFTGRDLRVSLETSNVKAGVSAGHVFFRIDTVGDRNASYCGRYVMRFDVGANRLFRQTSLRHQFDVMSALHVRGLAVPEAVWFDNVGVIAGGTPALIMRRVDAQAPHMLYMEQGPYFEASEARRKAMLDSYMQFCVQLHAQPVQGLGLDFLASRGGARQHFIDREINWIETELHSRFPEREEGERAPLLSRLRRTCDETAAWLRQHAPRHRTPVLVHGDITFGNVIFNGDGSVVAVLDWELCHEGLAAEDVTWLVLAARSAANFYKASMVAMPTMDDAVAAYRAAGGTLDDFGFAAVLTAYRLLAISALAMRLMPPEFWASQDELWDQQEALLLETMRGYEHATA